MNEAAQTVVDVVFKIVNAAGWILAIFLLFWQKIRNHVLKKTTEKENKKIIKNQTEQVEKEKELKNMAKFLCDRCGAETAVSEAVHYVTDDLTCDVCAACALILSERDKKIAEARAELTAAEQRVIEARAKLLDLTAGIDVKTSETAGHEQDTKPTESAASNKASEPETPPTPAEILNKLGL